MRTIRVNASRSYNILVGSGLLGSIDRMARPFCAGRSVVLVSDDNVAPLYGEAVRERLEQAGARVLSYTVPHGEHSKCIAEYERLLEFMCVNHISRSDVMAALGGGVVGDLTGFAAATYQRGIGYIQIPTSLLAAVDSSVGGKTAVNLEHGKNQAGCFHQPLAVLCDTDFLNTLPEEEYRCGSAEVIKYAVIGDSVFFDSLLLQPIREQTEYVIEKCVAMKRDLVARDEFDRGDRMLLNLGHTFGHAVEACSGYTVLHGQAVAMGMAAVSRAAEKMGVCEKGTAKAVETILTQYGLPTETDYPLDDMLEAALSDKKSDGSTVRLIVPERIGRCRIEPVTPAQLREWMKAGGVK